MQCWLTGRTQLEGSRKLLVLNFERQKGQMCAEDKDC